MALGIGNALKGLFFGSKLKTALTLGGLSFMALRNRGMSPAYGQLGMYRGMGAMPGMGMPGMGYPGMGMGIGSPFNMYNRPF